MNQTRRILIAVLLVLLIGGGVIGIEYLRGQAQAGSAPAGSIPVYFNGQLIVSFTPTNLEGLSQASFVDTEDGVTQNGWLLRDILLLFFDEDQLLPDTPITVTSQSRGKSARLTWAEIADIDNYVMFDLSNRGTLKLISARLPQLDTRDEWVQDTDQIEIGLGGTP